MKLSTPEERLIARDLLVKLINLDKSILERLEIERQYLELCYGDLEDFHDLMEDHLVQVEIISEDLEIHEEELRRLIEEV